MARFADIEEAARGEGLVPLGGLHPRPGDGAPEGCRTIVLLGPDGHAFWEHFQGSGEVRDGAPDPLDRWSERVVGRLADRLGAEPLFPFGGPPWRPFIRWARESGEAWASPVTILVHARLGLFASYRGALAFAQAVDLPPAPPRPCDACSGPCREACPVGALTGAGYDVAACHAYLDTAAGADCMSRGCAVRRACPVGADLRPEPQSAFHMTAFHVR